MKRMQTRGLVLTAAVFAVLAGCGGGQSQSPTASDSPAQTSTPGATPSPTDAAASPTDPESLDLSAFEGQYRITSSDAQIVEATGEFVGGTATIEGDTLTVVRADGSGVDTKTVEGGEGRVVASSRGDSLGFMGSGGPLEIYGPPFRVGNLVDGSPPSLACGYQAPAGTWEVELSPDQKSITYSAATTGGSGGDDGCMDSYLVTYTVEFTPAE